MKMLIQEACQGPVRDAFKAAGGDALGALTPDQLRPVVLRDFQVGGGCWVQTGAWRWRHRGSS